MLHHLLSVLSPCLLAPVLAYLFDPAVTWLTASVKKRGIAIALTYLLTAFALLGLLFGFLFLMIGNMPSGNAAEIFSQVESYFRSADAAAGRFLEEELPSALSGPLSETYVRLKTGILRRFSPASALTLLQGIGSRSLSFFIALVGSIYLLKDKAYFIALWESFLSLFLNQRIHGMLCEVLDEIHHVLATFLKAVMIDSILVAFLSSIVLTLLGLDYAVMIGILAGFFNIIPYFGPVFSMLPAFAAGFFSGGFWRGVAAAAALFCVQQVDSNYLYPKIVGSGTGLHPLFILFSVTVFGSLFGIIGMILAVPAAGITQIFIRRFAFRR